MLLLSLWLPWINQRISYASLSTEVTKQLPAKDYCVEAFIGPSQRASLAYFGGVHFAGFSDHDCEFLMLQHNRKQSEEPQLPAQYQLDQWQRIWNGHRAYDKDEMLTLYRRKAK